MSALAKNEKRCEEEVLCPKVLRKEVCVLQTNMKAKMRRRTSTQQESSEGRRRGRSNFQIKGAKACDQVITAIQDNPPGLICWLKGGVNLARAKDLEGFLERQP